MSIQAIIRRLCRPCLPHVHHTRVQAVEAVSTAIAHGGRLSLSSIGRSVQTTTMPKHSIKRVDRLLSNPHLHHQWWRFYQALATRVIGGVRRPVVVVDWSKAVDGFHALAAAVPVGGRAIPIYVEVHPESKYGNREVHRRFLQALGRVLPSGCSPTIVADAGFSAPFIHGVLSMNWDYVLRVRGGVGLQPEGSENWLKTCHLYPKARSRPRSLGTHRFALHRWTLPIAPTYVRLVLAPKPKRKSAKYVPKRAPRCGTQSAAIKAAREPWLLATSLHLSPDRVVALYDTRMQIEETFRDTKNHRFGWCLRHVRCQSANRMTTLLMLCAIAMTAVTFLGLVAEEIGVHRRYQANTLTRRVLSHFYLGSACIRRREPLPPVRSIDRIVRARLLAFPTVPEPEIRGDP